MLALISPAKKLDILDPSTITQYTQPSYLEETRKLVNVLKQKSRGELKSLMGISDQLAELNYERYQKFSTNFDMSNSKQAILAFQGDTYKGLDAGSLSEQELKYAQDHLRILSGLYGILRPLDLMQPYRLEMGTKLSNEKGENLYDFWNGLLTKACNDDAKDMDHKAIINLASNEYISSIKPDELNIPFITCHFKEIKDGEPKVVGLFAKKARGMMARYIIQNRIEEPQALKEFNEDGYTYDDSLSTGSDYVFTRKSK